MEPELHYRRHAIPVDILDELAARFIINMRDDERRDLIRVCFQIEVAHWFFIDFYVTKSPERKLQPGTMKEFAAHIFRHVPFLQVHAERVEEIVEEWREYKLAVPTFGAIILNTFLDKVLLVQGFWTKSSWGFPKGKVNEDEPPHTCAAREVLEETGFDISDRLNPDEYLEQVINDQSVRLYIIPGVPEDTPFGPRSRCEIKDIRWFDINQLPLLKSDQACKTKTGFNTNSFFMVIPFMRDLKHWVKAKNWERLQFSQEEAPKRSRRKSGSATKQREAVDRKTPMEARKISGEARKTPMEARKISGEARKTPMEARKTPMSRKKSDTVSTIHENAFPAVVANGDGSKSVARGSSKQSRRQLFDSAKIAASKLEPLFAAGELSALSGAPAKQQQRKDSADRMRSGSRTPVAVTAPAQRISQEHPALLPPNFFPQAWKNFRLDETAMVAAFMGLATSQRGRVI